MKQAILNKWVRALRSGRYKQGTERLKTLNGQPKFCCLGVLCDLHSKATGKKWMDNVHTKYGMYLGETGTLPEKVCQWAGLRERDPLLIAPGAYNSAAELNDNGKRFTTIAKLIEQAQKKKLI